MFLPLLSPPQIQQLNFQFKQIKYRNNCSSQFFCYLSSFFFFALVNLNVIIYIDEKYLKTDLINSFSDISARDVVNPPKSYEEVFKEGKEGHDLYIVSHNDYYAGKYPLV